MKHIFFVVIVFSIFIASCSNFLYTPTLLSPKRPEKGNVELTGSAASLIATRQDTLSESLELGIVGAARYSFSNSVAGQVKLWGNLKTKGGISVDLQHWDSTQMSLSSFWNLSIGAVEEVHSSGFSRAYGISVNRGYSYEFSKSTITTTSIGIMYGSTDFFDANQGWGLGFSLEPTIRYAVLSPVDISLSIPVVLQYNHFDKLWNLLPAPVITTHINL